MKFLACDLGAESGRVMLGTIENDRLELEELHRFTNDPVTLPTGLYWDAFRLYFEICRGLTVAGRTRGLAIDGIGVDTWGVDFALLASDGALIDNPRHYRDARNHGMVEKVFDRVPRADVFSQTGIQFMQINSLYQWFALQECGSPGLAGATSLLFMPDLFNYWLTGVKAAEVTIASTSQFYNPARNEWASDLLRRLRLDESILPEPVPPGTALGRLLPPVREATGLENTTVYTTCGHDTAAAVAATPGQGDDWCYISSGTWSLMGVELNQPLINEQTLAENFTNEVGAEGRIRLLKNIAGLWVLQECRRAWARAGREFSYEQLTQMAADAPAYGHFIDPDQFLEPGNMPLRIEQYCQRHGLPVPQTEGAMARAVLESLAERYRQVLQTLERLTGKTLNTIHIVGGGSKNRLLNQLVANATGRRVVAGPSEATAMGNIVVQAIGAGALRNLAAARELVARSCSVETFEPLSRATGR